MDLNFTPGGELPPAPKPSIADINPEMSMGQPEPVKTDLLSELSGAVSSLRNTGQFKESPHDLTQTYSYGEAEPYLQGFGSSGFVGNMSDEFNAQNQRWYHQLVNGTAKGLGIAATTFVNGTVGFLDGLGSVINSALNGKTDFSKLFDNDTSKASDQANKAMERWFPNYYTQKEKEASALSTDNLLTMNFLADKLIKNAGFAVGAIGTGYAYGAISRALNIGKLATLFTKNVNLGDVEAFTMSVGDDIANQGTKILSIVEKQQRAAKVVEDALINQIGMTMSTMGEANMEAYEGYNTVKERLISDRETILGRPLNETEMNDIESRAKEAANIRWLANVALLNVTNRIQLPKILGTKNFAGSRQVLNREVNDIAVESAGKQVAGQTAAKAGEQYVRKTAEKNVGKWATIMNAGKKVGSSLFSPSEAFEEGSQYVFQVGTEKYADYQTTTADYLDFSKHPENRSLFEDMISYGIPKLFSDKEGVESIILGGLTGGLMESISGGERAIERRREKNTQNMIGEFNKNMVTGYIKERFDAGVAGLEIEERQASGIARNDIYTGNNERSNGFINFLIPRLFYGRKDLAIEELMQHHSSRMSFDVAKDVLGLNDKATSKELDKHIMDSIAEVENIDKMLTHVEAVYPNLYAQDGTINPLAKGLLFATYKINDFEKRIAKMMGELTEMGLTDIGMMTNPKLRNEAGLTLEELRNKLNKDLKDNLKGKTINGQPVNELEYLEKLNDIERLQNLRETFINDYNQIRKQQFMGNAKLMNGMLMDDTKLDEYLAFERHMWNIQRIENYGQNTNSRLNANKLSNFLEGFLTGTSAIDVNRLQELIDTLNADKSYFYPEDLQHVNTLLQAVKQKAQGDFINAINGNISDNDRKAILQLLNPTPGAKAPTVSLDETMDYILDNADENIANDEGDEASYEALKTAYEQSKDLMNIYSQLDQAVNNGRATEPTAKDENDIRRDIAKMYENLAESIISSFELDKEGFDDVVSVERAIGVIKNLKRIFGEREDKFFQNNKAFGTKQEYLKHLTDVLDKLETTLQETKKNNENIQKNDINYAKQNHAFKLAVIGWATNTDSPDNIEIYNAIANIIGKDELDRLIASHKNAADSRYAYEIYKLLRNAINTDPSLGKSLQTIIDREADKLNKILNTFKTKSSIKSDINGKPSIDFWYGNIYNFYQDVLESFNAEAATIFRKTRNINDVLDYLNANKANITLLQPGYTVDDLIEHINVGEKLKALNTLTKINNVSPSFDFVKYWQAVDQKVQALKSTNIVPSIRQLQVVEDIVMDLFTKKDSEKEYDPWTYFNGRIGSGKTRVVASTLIDVLKSMTSQSDANKFVYLLGDKQVAGLNLEQALGLKQTYKDDGNGRISGGRDIDTLIQDLNNDAAVLKQVRFILGDEFARPSNAKLDELAKALAAFNKRNKKDLRLVAMGDTLQSTENIGTNVTIKVSSPNISLTTELATSYRSPLFSINVVQSIFDNALNTNVLRSKPKLVSLRETNPDGSVKIDGEWFGVTGVAVGTTFENAEEEMIGEVIERSKATVKEVGTGKDVPVTSIMIVTNPDNVAGVQAKLLSGGANMSVISILTIEQAQGLSIPDLYVHLDPNAKEYNNGKDMLKYNRDMYTALRATRYMHITTLEAENVVDLALKTRFQDIMQKAATVNNKVAEDVNNIKTHLETTFKVAPITPKPAATAPGTGKSGTGTTSAGTATGTGGAPGTGATGTSKTGAPEASTGTEGAENTNGEETQPEDVKRDYPVPDAIDIASGIEINGMFAKEVDLKDQLVAKENEINGKRAIIKSLSDKLATETDEAVIDDLVKEYDKEMALYDDLVSEFNALQNRLIDAIDKRGGETEVVPSFIPGVVSNESPMATLGTEEDFFLELLSDGEPFVVSIRPAFMENEDANKAEEISVAFPTSENFKTSTLIDLNAGEPVFIIPVIKNGKAMHVVYKEFEYNGVYYYHELGVLSGDQVKDLMLRGVIKSDKPFSIETENIRDLRLNAKVYRISSEFDRNSPDTVVAQLRNMQPITYQYDYASNNPTLRDGRQLNSIIDSWMSSANLTPEEFNKQYDYQIMTMDKKALEVFEKRYQQRYKTDSPNLTPLALGRTYIVIAPKDESLLPQFIELEPRTLITDSVTLSNPENQIMRDWYVEPLQKFVEAVEAYDAVLMDVLKKIGIDKSEFENIIQQLQFKVPGSTNGLRLVEEVMTFSHGNSIYNDLLYAFTNMSYRATSNYFKDKGYGSTSGDKDYKDKADNTYKAIAKPFYDKVFTAIEKAGVEKDLIMASRRVYEAIRGMELQVKKDEKRYYDLQEHKRLASVTPEQLAADPDRYIQIVSLDNRDMQLGGAQMAMNFIAYGNQNMRIDNEDGSTTTFSLGHVIKEKVGKGKDRQVRMRYMGRPLNDRRTTGHANAVRDKIFDNLFVNAMLSSKPTQTEIQFDGYQDRLIVARLYKDIINERELTMKSFEEFLAEANGLTADRQGNFDEMLKSLPEWEIFKEAVLYAHDNVVKVGHNADSIKRDILNKTNEDNTRHQFGNRSYNGKTRSVSLRMNAPIQLTADKENNWQSDADSTSVWKPMNYSPEERFGQFFTSSFTSFKSTELSIGFPGQNFSESVNSSTRAGESVSDEPIETTNPETTAEDNVQPEPNPAIEVLTLPAETADMTEQKLYKFGILLNPGQIKRHEEGEDVELMTPKGKRVFKADDDYDNTESPFLLVNTTTSSLLSNVPVGPSITATTEMLDYLRRFIPDITENDLRVINDIHANVLFGETSKTGLFGAFREGVIYAVRGNATDPIFKQVLKHEAFHKIFRQYLTPAQRKTVIQQAREEYNLFDLSDKEVEEYMAVNFQKRPDFDRPSLLQRFLNFLKRIYRFFVKHNESIEDFYKKVEAGYFAKPVALEDQYDSYDTAFLNTTEIFRDKAHLIPNARAIFNSAMAKGTMDTANTQIDFNNGMTLTNVPKSDFERVGLAYNHMKNRMDSLKNRMLTVYSYRYFIGRLGGAVLELTDESLKNEIAKGTPLFAMPYDINNPYSNPDQSKFIPLEKGDAEYPAPLSRVEQVELETLDILFNQFVYIKGEWNKSLQNTDIYMNFLMFVKNEYPKYYDSILKITKAGETIERIKLDLQNSEEEKSETAKELSMAADELAGIEDMMYSQADEVNILAQILDKDFDVNPYKTMTENVRTWLSEMHIRDANGASVPVNPKQAIAILYQRIRLFNAQDYKQFERAVKKNFGVEQVSLNIDDPTFITTILQSKKHHKAKKFLVRLANKYNVIPSEANAKRLSELVKKEISELVTSLAKTGKYTELADRSIRLNGKTQPTLLDLYTHDQLTGGINSVMEIISNLTNTVEDLVMATKTNLSSDELLELYYSQELRKYRNKLMGDAKKLKQGEETIEEFEDRVEEFEKNSLKKVIEKENELRKQFNSGIDRENKIAEIRKTLEKKQLQNRYKKQNTISEIEKTLNRLLVSGEYKYYGEPVAIELQNQLLRLAKYSYRNSVDVVVNKQLVSLEMPKHYYFKDENTFYMNGKTIRRNRKNGMSNKDFFKTIWYEWQMNTDVEEFKKHNVHMLNALYKKFKSNQIFLDIMTNYNNLVPLNLISYQGTKDFGAFTTQMLTRQEDDTTVKMAMNVSTRLIDEFTTIQKDKDGVDQPVLIAPKAYVEFYNKYFSSGYSHDPKIADIIYREFLTLLGLQNYYVQPSSIKLLDKVNTAIYHILGDMNSKYNRPILKDEDTVYDVSNIREVNRNYFNQISRYMNASRSIADVSSVKDLNGKSRYFRDTKSFADSLVYLLNEYRTATKDEKEELKSLIEQIYPHLKETIDDRMNYMALNPFNIFANNPITDHKNMNVLGSEFYNLDGTSVNNYVLLMQKETTKDYLNRMFNGHFLAGLSEKVPTGAELKYYVTGYTNSDKPRVKMIKSGVYSLSNTGNSKMTTREMFKMMLLQRAMMPAEMEDLKEYHVWRDVKNKYHLDGLEAVNQEELEKLIALTGKYNTYQELVDAIEKEKIDLDSIISEWYAAIKNRSNDVINYIQDLNAMSLGVSKTAKTLKYGVPLVSNLASIYKTLLEKKVLRKEDIQKDGIVEVEVKQLEGGKETYEVKLIGYNVTAKNYNVNNEHIRPIIELFYENTYINDFFLNQMIQGDPAFYKGSIDSVKRMSSPYGNTKTPLISNSHAPATINTLLIDEYEAYVYVGTDPTEDVENKNLKRSYSPEEFKDLLSQYDINGQRDLHNKFKLVEVTNGGGYMSERSRDAFNRGFGTGLKMGNTAKPLAHWFTEKGNPINDKYALTVITDEYARKFPQMLELRLAMDFAGLTPSEFERARELEKKRLFESVSILEFKELQTLYDKAIHIDQAVPPSAVKYGAIKEPVKFDHETKTWKGFGYHELTQDEYDALSEEERNKRFNALLYLNTTGWGLQLDSEDDVDAKVSLPTQLLYFANVNGNNPDANRNIQEALIGLHELTAREFEEMGISGQNTSLEDMTNVILKGLQGKQNHANLYEALSDSKSSINLPIYANAAISQFNTAFDKNFLKVKFNGTKGVQIPEALSNDYSGRKLQWYPDTQTAEVYMPISYRDHVLSQNYELYEEWKNEKNPNNRLILEKQILDSLPITMLGFRIPSTGLNSAVKIKIVGFVDETSNRVILPIEVVLRMGSDYDIDTLYILRPHLSGGNNRLNAIARALGIEPNTPYGYDFDGNHITDFKQRIANLRANPLIVEEYIDSKGQPKTKTFRIGKRELQSIERDYYKNMFIYNYLDIITDPLNLADVNKALNFDRAVSIMPLENDEKSLYVVLASLKNEQFRIQWESAVKSENFDESIYNPDVASKLKKLMEKEIEKSYTLTNIFDRAELQVLNQTGKTLTGIFASVSKTLAYLQSTFGSETKFKTNDKLWFQLNGTEFDGSPVLNETTGTYQFWIKNDDGTTTVRTFDELQWMVNAAIDNAKEQILAKLSINAVTANIANGAFSVGLPIKDLVILLQQPASKELLKYGKIDSNIISYLEDKLLRNSKYDLDDEIPTHKIIEGIIGTKRFSTSLKPGFISISDYVNESFSKEGTSLQTLDLNKNEILNPNSKYDHEFEFAGETYPNLSSAKGLFTSNFSEVYEAYLRSFGDKFIENLNLYSDIDVDRRYNINKAAVKVIQKLQGESVYEFYQNNQQLVMDDEFLASQLYTLKVLRNLDIVGNGTFKIQQALNILSKNPNSVADLIDFKEAMAEIFKITYDFPNGKPYISSVETIPEIMLPSNTNELELNSDFAFAGIELDKIPLFKSAYEKWYHYNYIPQIQNVIMQSSYLGDLVTRFKRLYGISASYNPDSQMSNSEEEVMMRSTIVRMLLTKLHLKTVNDNGVVETIPMDTIGKRYISKGVEYTGNRALFQETYDLYQKALSNIENAENAFLASISVEEYNVRLQSGEIKMMRKNTSDDRDITSMKDAFLLIDQRARVEFMENNPEYPGYWLSPLQKAIINYSVIFEGLGFGSSKLALYLPNDVTQQFSNQLDGIFKEIVEKDLFKSIEEFTVLQLARGETSWVKDLNFNRMQGVGEQAVFNYESQEAVIIDEDESNLKLLEPNALPKDATIDDKNQYIEDLKKFIEQEYYDLDLEMPIAPNEPATEKEKDEYIQLLKKLNEYGKSKKNSKKLKATTIKFDPTINAFYHLKAELPKNGSIQGQRLFLKNEYDNNVTVYIRLNITDNEGKYVYYLALPKLDSLLPKLPDSVLDTQFNLESLQNGKAVFINKNKSIIEEDGKLYFYNSAGIPMTYKDKNQIVDTLVYGFDNSTHGYLQNVQAYKIVDVKFKERDDSKSVSELYDKLKAPGISLQEANDIQAEIRKLHTRYELVPVGDSQPIQNHFPAKNESTGRVREDFKDALPNSLLRNNAGIENEILTGILKEDRINHRGTFDSSNFTDYETRLIDSRIKKGLFNCK